MNRHATTEQLSAYLDMELGLAELRQLEAHCEVCEKCRAQLTSMRQVVHGLGNVQRAVPSEALRQRIRRQVLHADPLPANRSQAMLDWVRLHILPLQPALRSAAAMGLAMVVGLFAYNHIGDARPHRTGQEIVTVEAFLDAPVRQTTTSEVAGREFIWTESGWIQRGLEGKIPQARVSTGSPRGRALLNRHSDLGFLLADGSPVVLRYNLETVEIRNSPPTRVLGYGVPTGPGRVLDT